MDPRTLGFNWLGQNARRSPPSETRDEATDDSFSSISEHPPLETRSLTPRRMPHAASTDLGLLATWPAPQIGGRSAQFDIAKACAASAQRPAAKSTRGGPAQVPPKVPPPLTLTRSQRVIFGASPFLARRYCLANLWRKWLLHVLAPSYLARLWETCNSATAPRSVRRTQPPLLRS